MVGRGLAGSDTRSEAIFWIKESYDGIVKTAANALTFAELGIQGQMHEGKVSLPRGRR